MKKITLIIISIILVFILSGCQNEKRRDLDPNYIETITEEYGIDEVYSEFTGYKSFLDEIDVEYSLGLPYVPDNPFYVAIYGRKDDKDVLLYIPSYEKDEIIIFDSIFPDYDDIINILNIIDQDDNFTIIYDENSFSIMNKLYPRIDRLDNPISQCDDPISMEYSNINQYEHTSVYLYLGIQQFDCYYNSIYLNFNNDGFYIYAGNEAGINILYSELS